MWVRDLRAEKARIGDCGAGDGERSMREEPWKNASLCGGPGKASWEGRGRHT
jgi:hypothetical protein